jgi:hypothetical protein
MTPNHKKYETDRTRALRSGKLSEFEREAIDKIEEFGLMVLHVQNPGDPRPAFSYTLGLHNTRNVPELITCGLPSNVAQRALNYAADLLADGIDLTQGRHRDLIGNVDVEFGSVDRKWVEELMLSAIWFNGSSDFPSLQLIYPDLDNRFPGDEGFNVYFEQPLLQPGAPMGRVEEDFRALNDPNSSLFDWKFPNPPHTGVFLSKAVHEGGEGVNFVSHDADDGAWQFLGDSMSDSGGVLVCFHHPIDSDPSLKELADLPLGWYAERAAPGEPWIRRETPPTDESTEQD